MGKPDKIYPQLITGEVYTLDVYRCGHAPAKGEIYAYSIAFRTDGLIGLCPYESWQAFYKNWLPYYEK